MPLSLSLSRFGPAVWLVLAGMVYGCPSKLPDNAQFSNTVTMDAGDTGAALTDADSGGDAAGGDTAGLLDVSDLVDTTVDSKDGSAADAAVGADADVGADSASPDAAADFGPSCSCVSTPDCAGIATATCQVATCKNCTCLVTVAPEGQSCGVDLSCQTGKCLPVVKDGPWAKAITAGGHHSCAIRSDGTAACWGNSGSGQVGSGVEASVVDTPQAVAVVSGVSSLCAGNTHTCAVHGGGKVSCWGDNFNGQIGDGDNSDSVSTATAAGSIGDGILVAAGTYFSFAVRKGATLWGWGNNNGGVMLQASLTSPQSPVQVAPILDVQQACGGDHHACALHGDGKVECWGRNTDGQVGHGVAEYNAVPIPAGPVTGLPAVTGIACGHYHTCAWDSSGKVWCWGKNMSGQIGTGNYSTNPANAAIPFFGFADVKAMACGQGHTCALRAGGLLACWGENEYGQSGANGVGDAYKATSIDIGGKAIALAAGTEHTCALREDGSVWCWGRNANGQLGNAGTVDSFTPVLVAGTGK